MTPGKSLEPSPTQTDKVVSSTLGASSKPLMFQAGDTLRHRHMASTTRGTSLDPTPQKYPLTVSSTSVLPSAPLMFQARKALSPMTSTTRA